jgi:CRP-like cAMP-binding protein
MQSGFAFSRFADRLGSLVELSAADMDLLARMPSTISHHSAHDIVMRADDSPHHCCLLLQGYLCWRAEDSSSSQIISIHVPGDVPDLHTFQTLRAGAHLGALGPVVVAMIPHAFLDEIAAASPGMSRALSILLLSECSTLRNWVLNLGSRDALTRVAHLVCDIVVRLRAVGLAKDMKFVSPLTQADLGAACAISPVHANRIVQELRRRELLRWESRMITIIDWVALTRVAAFRHQYLWLRRPDTVLPREPTAFVEAHLTGVADA